MHKLILPLIAAVACVGWAADAVAQTTIDAPVNSGTGTASGSATTSSASSSTVSDLPAPETTSLVNRPLLITSSILLVGSYAGTATVAFTSSRPEDQKYLYIPVAGPWLDLLNRHCEVRPCNNEGLNTTLLVGAAIGQGLGAVGLITSFFIPGKTTRNWYLIGGDTVHAGPTRVGASGYGFGAAGTF